MVRTRKNRSMVINVLLRHGFFPVKNDGTFVYVRHSETLGTVMVVPNGDRGVINIPELNVCEVLKVSKLERFLNYLQSKSLL